MMSKVIIVALSNSAVDSFCLFVRSFGFPPARWSNRLGRARGPPGMRALRGVHCGGGLWYSCFCRMKKRWIAARKIRPTDVARFFFFWAQEWRELKAYSIEKKGSTDPWFRWCFLIFESRVLWKPTVGIPRMQWLLNSPDKLSEFPLPYRSPLSLFQGT